MDTNVGLDFTISCIPLVSIEYVTKQNKTNQQQLFSSNWFLHASLTRCDGLQHREQTILKKKVL